ncbi:hypothetical protein JOC34_000624 [Virgibacillus halotolerans]|uniref:hypothetical protein n=1 Tax=Virgibacillus halotolerans TaxID=1071053 RepID=UPI00195FC9EC|nr:hypothetical protein [Virgibacillus halotolerans]MBM7598267.1 hypothetical protein [Virgibacillus halotolerans]
MTKQTFYTSESGRERFCNGEVFPASDNKRGEFTIEFTVSPDEVVDRMGSLVMIDTGSQADL